MGIGVVMNGQLPEGFELIPDTATIQSYNTLPEGFELIDDSGVSPALEKSFIDTITDKVKGVFGADTESVTTEKQSFSSLPEGFNVIESKTVSPGRFDKILEFEGGIVDDPDDPGGYTAFGLSTLRYGDSVRDVKSREDALPFYEKEWNSGGYNQINDEYTARHMFDINWLSGGGQKHIIDKAAEEVGFDTTNLNQSINSATPEKLKEFNSKLVDKRKAYFDKVIKNNPKTAKFRRNWNNRADYWRDYQPIDQFQVEKSPEEMSMFELVKSKVENLGAAFAESTSQFVGQLGSAIDLVTEPVTSKIDELVTTYGPEQFRTEEFKSRLKGERQEQKELSKGVTDKLKQMDFGYEEQENWEGIKQAFKEGGPLSGSAYGKVLEFGIEQGVRSLPQMVAAVYALPSVVVASSERIGDERAKNKGKERTELVDVLEASPYALGSALLERVGAKGVLNAGKEAVEEVGKEALKSGIKEVAKRTAKSGVEGVAKEGLTEAVQEGIIEYTGERFGTSAKMDLKEALDRGAAAFVAGGVLGGIGGAASGISQEITRKATPEAETAETIIEDLQTEEKQPDPTPTPTPEVKEDPIPIDDQIIEKKPGRIRAEDQTTVEDILRGSLRDSGIRVKEGDVFAAFDQKKKYGQKAVDKAVGALSDYLSEYFPERFNAQKDEPLSWVRDNFGEDIKTKIFATEYTINKAEKDVNTPFIVQAIEEGLSDSPGELKSVDDILGDKKRVKITFDGDTYSLTRKGESIILNGRYINPTDVTGKSLYTGVPVSVKSGALAMEVPQNKTSDYFKGIVKKKPIDTIKSIESKYENKNVDLRIYEKNKFITLSKIVVPKDKRGSGIGSEFMNDIINVADTKGKIITLTPSSDFGGNISRLKKFYKRFGFVENKGRNKDYEISDTMYREPVEQKDQPTTEKQAKKETQYLLKNEDQIKTDLSKQSKKQIAEEYRLPRTDLSRDKIVSQAYNRSLYDNVAKSGIIVDSKYSKSIEDQVKNEVNQQTDIDVKKSIESTPKQVEFDDNGKTVYPEYKADINTEEYLKDNKPYTPPKEGERIYNAPGHNYLGLMRSTGLPARRENITIDGKNIPIGDKVNRIEPIMRKLIQIVGRRIYSGEIRGKSAEGFYRQDVGEIRTRKKNDVEVLAHEMAHYLDEYSSDNIPNFRKLYKQRRFDEEITGLSYTDANPEIEKIEGFAEFVRLWLTNSEQAKSRAPQFYRSFNRLLGDKPQLKTKMNELRELMHKFFFQGADNVGKALIGQKKSFIQRFEEWKFRRDGLFLQQTVDRFRAARDIEKALTGKIGKVSESAWKMFRMASTGAESIADYIMNYGTIMLDSKGNIKTTGKGLHEILSPVKTIDLKKEHLGDQKIDVLMRYFAGKRAIELHSQGRENLIPVETAKKWSDLDKDYPVFKEIFSEYQLFNDRMMDFYEDMGLITPESRKLMQSMNKDYVPFNRIIDDIAAGKTGSSAGFQKLKGGTSNLNDILVNIQDGIVSNVRSALNNKAKQQLYNYISDNKDGALYATKLPLSSKKISVYKDEMKAKINKILEEYGVIFEGSGPQISDDMISFWQHGVRPTLTGTGNIVDSVIINGKQVFYEVQDPMLQDMLLSMKPDSYSQFMNIMFGVKDIFTTGITLGAQFIMVNPIRDTQSAYVLSHNGFKPFIDSFRGMYSFLRKDKLYQDFLKSGGGYSSRIMSLTREGKARKRVKLHEYGKMSFPEKVISAIDNISSAFEYGTRIGEFNLAKKNNSSDLDAGFAGREISTDFGVEGSNHFITGYIRTVPFLNAMIQSQDRLIREVAQSKKYDGNPTGVAMKAFLGLTIPTMLLYLVNKDDEDYKQIPDYEKRTNWHIKVGEGRFVKVPRPYDVGFVFATMPELFFKYMEDDKGKEFADGMLWTLTQMYGIDGTPAMATGWLDVAFNKKWTGAPVVPQSMMSVSAKEQYNSNTSETFIRLGEMLGVSPLKAQHIFSAYTGYLGGYLMAGTDHMLWDKEKFGEKPERDLSENIFLQRFLTRRVRPATSSMNKFFDLKQKSDEIVATFRQKADARRAITGKMEGAEKFEDDPLMGLYAEEKEVLFALNKSMNQIIKLIFGKEGIKTAEIAVRHDKNLTGKQKRQKIDELWEKKNNLLHKYYIQADKAISEARKKAKQESE